MVSPKFDDAKVGEIAEKFKGIVEKNGGSVEKASKWDKRKLAFEVGGFNEANYILMHFDAPATVPHELRRQMSISDDVLRHLIILRED